MRRSVLVSTALTFWCGCAFAAITDDLVVYLPFDETTGSIAADNSGNGRDADIFNRRTIGSNPFALEDGPLPTPDNGGASDWWFWNSEGRFGGAFAPRGVANIDGEPTAPSLPGPNGATHAMAATNFGANIDSESWSVSMWAKLPYSANISASDMTFYNSYDWAAGFPDADPDYWNFGEIQSPRWMFLEKLSTFSNNDLSVSYGGGCCTTRANPALTEAGDPLASLVDGEWHNVVVTLQYPSFPFPSPADQYAFVYVDGELAQTVGFSSAVERNNGVIGAFTIAQASTFGGDTSAYIDDFAVWNRVLTPEEITFLSQNPVIGSPGVSGDFNMDGAWNCLDVDDLVAQIVSVKGGGAADLAFDMTGDGNVNDDDLAEWLVAGGANNPGATGGNPFLVGDATLDGSVDVSDFNQWNSSKFTSTPAWCNGDFNADGSVDVSDFNLWNGNKFNSSAPSAVPEPSSQLMMLFLCGWLVWRRRMD